MALPICLRTTNNRRENTHWKKFWIARNYIIHKVSSNANQMGAFMVNLEETDCLEQLFKCALKKTVPNKSYKMS